MDTRDAVEEGIQETNKVDEDNKRAEEEAAKDLGLEPEEGEQYDKKFSDNSS